MIEKAIVDEAPKASGNSAKAIGKTKSVKLPTGTYYVEVGLKRSIAPWNEWKGLYYNHYGFRHAKSGKRVVKHVGWFDRAKENVAVGARKVVLDRIREQIRKATE